MEMMRKLPKKSHNHGISYPMVEETKISNGLFMYATTYDSNGNFIRKIMYRNNSKIDENLD